MKLNKIFAVTLVAVSLSACTEFPGPVSGPLRAPKEYANLEPVQKCAIGYDMAKQVYKLVQVNKTVINVSPRLGGCGKHAINYLRKAGYAVDDTASKHATGQFSISTYEDVDTGHVFATAYLPGVKLTRSYKRAYNGMLAVSSVNIAYDEGL